MTERRSTEKGAALSDPSEQRRQLVRRMLERKGIRVGADVAPIRPRPGPRDVAPLSFHQEGLWFIDRLGPSDATYAIPGTLRLRGRLDTSALRRSLAFIVARHESLRARFVDHDGDLRQVISPPADWTLPETDLRDQPASEREQAALEIATREARRPFDLAAGPLFRSRLLRLDAESHVLILGVHHIAADGWSMGVLVRELRAAYEALLRGDAPGLPELPVQYGDFAHWQRESLRGEALSRLVGSWARRLEGAPRALELPTDRPRPRSQTFRGGHVPVSLDAELSKELAALARRSGSSLYMVLLAAFGALLNERTDEVDIVIGSTFSNRERRELEGVIGHFANTMPLRIDLSGDPRFAELVTRVGEVLLAAHADQSLPFPVLIKHLGVERDPSRNPVYQVVFDLLTLDRNPAVFGYGLSSPARESFRLGDLTASAMDVEGGESRFDIAVFLWDMPDGLSGSFEYSTDLFHRDSVAGLVAEFELLLKAVIEAPDRRLSELAAGLRAARDSRHEADTRSYRESLRRGLKQARRRPVRLEAGDG